MISNVCLRNPCGYPHRLDLGNNAGGAFGYKVVYGHTARVVTRQGQCDAPARALPRASDERNLAAEIERIRTNHSLRPASKC